MPSDDDGRATCPHCDRDFPSREKMVRHSKSVHGKGPGKPHLKKVIAGLAILAIVAVIVVAVWQAPGAPAGREANMEALGATDDPYLGNETAPVVVVEFATPACPSCRHFHQNTLPNLKQNYVDNGQVVFYYAQFNIGYPFGEPGGIAQECVNRHAGNQAFFDFTEFLYANQGQVDANNLPAVLRDFADDQGLDGDALVACYRDQATADAYEDDVSKGRANGVSGTPTFFVFGDTGEATQAGAGELAQAIRQALSEARSTGGNATGA